MDTILKLINAYSFINGRDMGYNKLDTPKLFSLYKYLINKFWKEDVDLVMYDEFNYECDNQLCNKRIQQDNFRKMLIDRYEQCIITGHGELVCEACHIKSYILSNDDEKYDINNGLLLDSSYHKLFDLFYISINPETYRLEINEKLDKIKYDFVWKNHNKIINVNKLSNNYLTFHYNLFNG